VRIDKWLWSVRLFKKRPDASDACHSGRVTLNGHEAKPSRHVRVEDVIEFRVKSVKRRVVVKMLINKRVSADRARPCYEDQTPVETRSGEKLESAFRFPSRLRGEGRPTKKQRRDMDRQRDEWP
jgi:ribosome-associated heat shock protein Hsp15